ncbi:MAG: DNA-3-methyladenine glycosylase [Planctomycetota bacterium]|nr:DNA-3-methyladenine glycosylase [Planctomycetota bacterium]
MSGPTRLDRSFFATQADTLAPRLIGCVLARREPGGRVLRGRIVEVEAYLGAKDRASHAYAGRRTPRNEAMYMREGTLYVYFTYGMHHCLNVVCAEEGVAQAVLVRALEAVDGLEVMRARRARAGRVPADEALCRGPGNVCKALGVDLAQNRADLCDGGVVWLEAGAGGRLGVSARIGVSSAGAWARRRLRWFERENRCVSGTGALSGRRRRT